MMTTSKTNKDRFQKLEKEPYTNKSGPELQAASPCFMN